MMEYLSLYNELSDFNIIVVRKLEFHLFTSIVHMFCHYKSWFLNCTTNIMRNLKLK
jgi:hypothetical protein